jgi:hypothetical protein
MAYQSILAKKQNLGCRELPTRAATPERGKTLPKARAISTTA